MEGPSSQQTMEVLEKRLEAAEHDTQDLIDKLGTMGFGKNSRPAERDVMDQREVISPYQAKIVDVDILKDNYETLVSRVCKTESVIQTLKLNMINLQGNRDLKMKNSDDYEQKYDMLKETYEQELGKLRRKLNQVTDDLKTEHEARLKAKEEIKELNTELENATVSKVSILSIDFKINDTKQRLLNLAIQGKGWRHLRQRSGLGATNAEIFSNLRFLRRFEFFSPNCATK